MEQEPVVDQPEPRKEEGWGWIGAPDHPDAEKYQDGLSDLFEVDTDEINDDVDDLVDVDYEKDILDANDNGDLEDLVDVSEADIMGSAPRPRQRRVQPRPRRIVRYQPPTSLGGFR
jgi:hypothetical protein